MPPLKAALGRLRIGLRRAPLESTRAMPEEAYMAPFDERDRRCHDAGSGRDVDGGNSDSKHEFPHTFGGGPVINPGSWLIAILGRGVYPVCGMFVSPLMFWRFPLLYGRSSCGRRPQF